MSRPIDSKCHSVVGSPSQDMEKSVEITAESDLSNVSRRIWIVTTAALPWLTGTSVNPLMRALLLTRGRPKHHVTLVVPWLQDVNARKILYGEYDSFELGGKQAQEAWIRDYCRNRAGCREEEENLRIQFWDGVYNHSFGSIFPTIDICSLIPKGEADIAILEEPEHLTWFRIPPDSKDDAEVLGWARKFRYVVGILHTNYDNYIREYGMGTSLITAPALHALSALVVRAYCNRLIRLSSVLPSLDANREVTANVHGVRSEFFDAPTKLELSTGESFAHVYFIGKLIWAKGFDKVLDLQERYKTFNGSYFDIDVYGTGNDAAAIQRAFFGRRHGTSPDAELEKEELVGAVFGYHSSLRSQLCDKATDPSEGSPTWTEGQGTCYDDYRRPFHVFSDFSRRALNTGVETAGAALDLIESVKDYGLRGLLRLDKEPNDRSGSVARPKNFTPQNYLCPARAAFKWRNHPLPARFLGRKDHIYVRDIPEHKIFLNMSTSEVLCTTSAEALAMGKFVILPKHPSNEFFFQFPNCLPYANLDGCVEKLQYALSNSPEPLSATHSKSLSWEGATERLFQASSMGRHETNSKFVDESYDAAKFHVESARKGQYLLDIFGGKLL